MITCLRNLTPTRKWIVCGFFVGALGYFVIFLIGSFYHDPRVFPIWILNLFLPGIYISISLVGNPYPYDLESLFIGMVVNGIVYSLLLVLIYRGYKLSHAIIHRSKHQAKE